LIQLSGIARYGTTSETEPNTEDSPAATDYLAQVTTKWEAAIEPAAGADVRVVILRTSPVLDSSGGPFRPMKLAWSAAWERLSAMAVNGCP
jgi:NAD dependent epimerase/dehydratase family enzyme